MSDTEVQRWTMLRGGDPEFQSHIRKIAQEKRPGSIIST